MQFVGRPCAQLAAPLTPPRPIHPHPSTLAIAGMLEHRLPHVRWLPPPQDEGFDPAQPDPSGPMQLIDFEYCAYTPRGFDIGNHFNEYAGFECDYSRWAGGRGSW